MNNYELEKMEVISNKIMEISFECHLDNIKHLIACLEKQIAFYNLQLNHLNNNKPFWFQKRKMEEYNIKVRELQDKISYYYDCILVETSYIDEVKNIKF